jgi:exodeoxyribonuclease III
MKIYSWNVNGIRATLRSGALIDFIEKHDPDVLCLQETKAHPDQVELGEIEQMGYRQFWSSADKKGYSGTAIFTRENVLSSQDNFPEEILNKFNLKDSYGDMSREGRICTVELADFYITTVYTPNSKNGLERLALRTEGWDAAYLAYIKYLEQTKPVIFCGDINVAHTENDLARPETNHKAHGFTDEERAGFQAFVDNRYIDTFRKFTPEGNGFYTWWTAWGGARQRNVGWRIDYVLTSEALESRLVDASIHADVLGSDHCPVSLEIN